MKRPVGPRPTGRYRVGVDAIETSPRSPFPALFNFRDVGGYTGHDGRTIRRGRLYRSDSLHRIDETDREAHVRAARTPAPPQPSGTQSTAPTGRAGD